MELDPGGHPRLEVDDCRKAIERDPKNIKAADAGMLVNDPSDPIEFCCRRRQKTDEAKKAVHHTVINITADLKLHVDRAEL